MPLPRASSRWFSPDVPELPDHTTSNEDFSRDVDDALSAMETWQKKDIKELLRIITILDARLETIHSLDVANQLLAKHKPKLCEELEKVQESREYKAIRKYLAAIIPVPLPDHSVTSDTSESATTLSWDHPFQGAAHRALWDHIEKYAETEKYYAPYCSIVQSSGTGKSRCIDELSKEHLLVPMNLRNPTAGGYPASDEQLYRFFTTETTSPTESAIRMNAFLCSLLDQLKVEIEIHYNARSDAGSLASWLHEFMTEGQSFSSQGPRRVAFYDKVIVGAEHLASKAHVVPTASSTLYLMPVSADPSPSAAVLSSIGPSLGPASTLGMPPSSPAKIRFLPKSESHASEAAEAARALRETCRHIEEEHRSSSSHSSNPFIVLAFDEAHTLTQSDTADPDDTTSASSPFAHLRRVLRTIGCDVFSVFLSTTGKITQFTSPRELDPSNRVSSGAFNLVPPFTALGWDHLALRVRGHPAAVHFKDIGFEYQVYLGRPMFGTRHHAAVNGDNSNAGSRNAMLQFAIEKLLCVSYPLPPSRLLTDDQQTACLAQRLPIEFMSTAHAVPERRQVENHMRVCIAVHDSFISMVTLNSSEPILSDAASEVMREHQGNTFVPQALSRLLTGCSIHKGDRGELIGMLLAILARDEVVHHNLSDPQYPGFFPVLEFLKKLLAVRRSPASNAPSSSRTAPVEIASIDDILAAKPSVFRDDAAKNTPLAKAFSGIYMHFNHFVKRGAQGLGPRQLIGFFIRNAAFMSANSQTGIDFGFALCNGYQVLRTSTSVFLVQVKNDSRYSAKIEESLFDLMDPVSLGIVKNAEELNIPIIRLVMALAGRTPALTYVKTQKKSSFTAYDIWVSGLNKDIYPIVGENGSIWRDILRASYGWKAIYDGEKAIRELKKTMTPMAGNTSGFWNWLKPESGSAMEEDMDYDHESSHVYSPSIGSVRHETPSGPSEVISSPRTHSRYEPYPPTGSRTPRHRGAT